MEGEKTEKDEHSAVNADGPEVLGSHYVVPRSATCPQSSAARSRPNTSPSRRLLEGCGLFLVVLLVFRAVIAEPYAVPTGSMAPTLLGNHRATVCPRCGYPVRVGCRDDLSPGDDYYRCAFCPNCGYDQLDLDHQPECRGDHLLVNKNLFDWTTPQRWEMAVFRCPADPARRAYVKRVVALGGEAVELVEGKVFIDGQLARKSLAAFKALRMAVYDQDYPPQPGGWQPRWRAEPAGANARLEGTQLIVEARGGSAEYQWLIYHHWQLDDGKDEFVSDEYSYNGARGHGRNPVHDFMVECDVEVSAGDGAVALALTDGLDELQADLPVGVPGEGARLSGIVETADDLPSAATSVYQTAVGCALQAGKKHHVEFAFVDRRATLMVDGKQPFPPVDRPGDRASLQARSVVTQPFRIGARGVTARVSNVRLSRDLYYTDANHGSHGPVQLKVDEYFVLGDNSPNSEDNRFWRDKKGNAVPVPAENFLGRPFLIHLPSRIVRWQGLGRQWESQTVDLGRVRWLR